MAHGLISFTTVVLLLVGSFSPAWPATAHGKETDRQSPRLLADGEYYPSLLAEVREASQSIDLAMYLWKPTKSPQNKPRQLLMALLAASRRGVQVRVLLEYSGYDEELNRSNRETAKLLEQAGIKVAFDGPGVTTHAKLVVIDNHLVFLGSHNLTQSALGKNHELSLLLDDPELAARLKTYLDKVAQP